MTLCVAVATLNSARYIDRCLRSLTAQSRPPAQILVIDGGSTDGTLEQVREWQKQHPTVELDVFLEKGLALARNRAATLCREAVLLFIDSDAEAAPDLVERVASRYAAEPDLVALGGQGVEDVASRWDRLRAVQYSQTWGPAPRTNTLFLYGLCSSYRVEALRAVGLFSSLFLSSGEDVEIGCKLRRRGYRLHYDPSLRVTHFRRDDARSLLQMVDRWMYYGHRAMLLHGEFGTSPLLAWSRFARRVLRIPLRRPRAPVGLTNRLFMARCFYVEAAAMWRAERDFLRG